MDISRFQYDLPAELIAEFPSEPRDASKLLIIDRQTGSLKHKKFYEIADILSSSDLLVVNDTKVFPAKLAGKKRPAGAALDILLLKRASGKDESLWEALVKPLKRVRRGTLITFEGGKLSGEVAEKLHDRVIIKFHFEGNFSEVMENTGEVPLPPYIKRKQIPEDKGWYGTVYAEKDGSIAAPTAGFHFTKELMATLKKKGVAMVALTLHVGWGTFKPVRKNDIRDHRLEPEFYSISKESAEIINKAKKKKNRIIAVGTTTTRVLETVAGKDGEVRPGEGYTDKFIYPGYEFRVIDGIITNFHLPRTTLLMLVCAFAGMDKTLRAYECAVEKRYRFYSYGDAMLVL